MQRLSTQFVQSALSSLRELHRSVLVCSAIDWVSQNRVAQMGHMDPDLMGAAGFQVAGHLAHKWFRLTEAFCNFVVGDGFPRSLSLHRACDGDFQPIVAAASKRGIYRTFAWVWFSPNEGGVGTLQSPVASVNGELLLQVFQRGFSFGHNHQAARFLVQPVNDARAELSADAGEVWTAMGKEGVHQSAIWGPWRWMDNKSCRLVDDDKLSILVHDGKGDVFRLRCGGTRRWQGDTIGLVLFDPVRDLTYRPLLTGCTSRHMSFFDQRAYARPAWGGFKGFQCGCEIPVKPGSCILFTDTHGVACAARDFQG